MPWRGEVLAGLAPMSDQAKWLWQQTPTIWLGLRPLSYVPIQQLELPPQPFGLGDSGLNQVS